MKYTLSKLLKKKNKTLSQANHGHCIPLPLPQMLLSKFLLQVAT